MTPSLKAYRLLRAHLRFDKRLGIDTAPMEQLAEKLAVTYALGRKP